jgi:hypothetical protein
MDPILLKAIRDMLKTQDSLPPGTEVTPAHMEEFLRAKTEGKFGYDDAQKVLSGIDSSVGVKNIGRSLIQGASMNFADEILGKLPEAMGGGAGAEEEMRLKGEMFHRAHPVVDTAAGIAGAVAPSLLFPEGAAAKAASLGVKALRGAAIGAGVGTASGIGAGDDAQSRTVGGVVGGVGGGLLGGAIPAVAGGVAARFAPAGSAMRRVADAVEKDGGPEQILKNMQVMKDAGRGDVTTAADLGDHLRSAADYSATNSDDAYVPMKKLTVGRQRDQAGRLLDDVKSGAGETNYKGRMDQLKGDLSDFADGPQGYGGIRDANPPIDITKVSAALNKPTIQRAWKTARLAGGITTDSPLDALMQKLIQKNPTADPAMIKAAAKNGMLGNDIAEMANAEAMRPVTFDDIHGMKQLLDDKISSAYVKGNGALANAYKTVRSGVIDAMHASVPQSAAVDATYSAGKGLQESLKAGVKAWTMEDSQELAKTVAKLAPENLEQFRVGMASKLVSRLRNAATNGDEARNLVNMSQSMEDKLRVVFGDKATFDTFMSRVNAENELGKLKGVTSGSDTARRLAAAGFDPAEQAAHAAPAVISGHTTIARKALQVLAKSTTGAMQRNTASAMAPMLMTQGSPGIEELLKKLALGHRASLGKLATRVLPSAAGRASSLLQ